MPENLYWPGLGLLTGLVVLYFVGLAVNAYVVSRALRMSDKLFARIPVVKTIYLAIRDFTRFFPSSGQGSDLRRVVLVPFGPGKILGFVTAESGEMLRRSATAGETIAVYLPMSYMVGGYTIFLPRDLVEPTSLSVEEGMRIALMGGVRSTRTCDSEHDLTRPRCGEVRAVIIPVTQFRQNCSLVWCAETKLAAVIDPGGDLDKSAGRSRSGGRHAQQDPADARAHRPRRRDGRACTEPRGYLSSVRIARTSSGSTRWRSKAACSASLTRKVSSPTCGSRTAIVSPSATRSSKCDTAPGTHRGTSIFFSAPDKLAFVGDVLFAGSIGRTDFPGGDHATLIHSIRENLFVLGDDVRFVPGHGPMSTFGAERRTNPFVSDAAAAQARKN